MSDFPPVHDEASETPPWVPFVGAAILALLLLASILTSSVREALATGQADDPAKAAAAPSAPPAEP